MNGYYGGGGGNQLQYARDVAKRRAYDEYKQYFDRGNMGHGGDDVALGEYSHTDTDSATSIYIPLMNCRGVERRFRAFLEGYPGTSYTTRQNYETDAVLHYVEVPFRIEAPRQPQQQQPGYPPAVYTSDSGIGGIKLYGVLAAAVIAVCLMMTPDIGSAVNGVLGW